MAEIKIPKSVIDDFRKSSAAKLKGTTSELEKRSLQNIVDEPSWAMFSLLRPFIKGDLLYLTQQISFGDIEAEDRGDGYYRMEIPDTKLSLDLPPEFGKVKAQPKATKTYSGEARQNLLKDLATMMAPILFGSPGALERLRSSVQACCSAFGKVIGSQVTEQELMALFGNVLAQIQSAEQALKAADRVSEKLDEDERVALVESLMKIGGNIAKDPAFQLCCDQLGVEWDDKTRTVSVDPAGQLKKILLKAKLDFPSADSREIGGT